MLSKSPADEACALLALKTIQGIGNVNAHKLINKFGSAKAIFEANSADLKSIRLKLKQVDSIVNYDFSQLTPILNWCKDKNRHIITLESPYYPPLLAQINNPPLVLFAIGDITLLLTPQVAIVGSRTPTAHGLSTTYDFSQALCQHGLTITSGLAFGIDGEAHRAALESSGYTIAVMGTGLNRVYPACHRELAHQISKNGLLLSEKLPDEPADRGSFPQRNRIIAGMTLGTLVIEAARQSGSLITANISADEGREVYAIPGSIHNPLAKGCHHLIKQGAKLVETIEDIIEDLPGVSHPPASPSLPIERPSLSSEDAQFLNLIDFDITPIDRIVSRSQLTVEAVSNKLLLLELDGWIINSTGGYIRQ